MLKNINHRTKTQQYFRISSLEQTESISDLLVSNGQNKYMEFALSDQLLSYGFKGLSSKQLKVIESNQNHSLKGQHLITNQRIENLKKYERSVSKNTQQFSFSLDIQLSDAFKDCQKTFISKDQSQGKKKVQLPTFQIMKYFKNTSQSTKSGTSYPIEDETQDCNEVTSWNRQGCSRKSINNSLHRLVQNQSFSRNQQIQSFNTNNKRTSRLFSSNISNQPTQTGVSSNISTYYNLDKFQEDETMSKLSISPDKSPKKGARVSLQLRDDLQQNIFRFNVRKSLLKR